METRSHIKKIVASLAVSVVAFLPHVVFAANATLFTLFCTLAQLVDLATPIIVAIALAGFFWGLAMYVFSLSGDGGSSSHAYGAPATPQNKNAGKNIMLYGIITFFVMFSIWGIVNVLQATFDVGGGTIVPPSFPGIPTPEIPARSC